MKRYFVLGLGLAAALCALAAPALAAARDDVLYGISRCGGIADDRTWLGAARHCGRAPAAGPGFWRSASSGAARSASRFLYAHADAQA